MSEEGDHRIQAQEDRTFSLLLLMGLTCSHRLSCAERSIFFSSAIELDLALKLSLVPTVKIYLITFR